MADQKISQLPTITGANMADNDKFVLVDTSGNATVATTRAEFFKSVPDVTFGDNDKAIFGSGSDLQIYHDSSVPKSVISEQGGGPLELRTSQLNMTTADGSSDILRANSTSVKLYGNNAVVLNATSTGIDVTGIISTLNGTNIDMDNTASGQLKLDGNGYAGAIALNAQGMNIYTNSASRDIIFGTNETEVMRIDGAGLVGIGTASPDQLLHLEGTNATGNTNPITLRFTDTDTASAVNQIVGRIEFEGRDATASGVGSFIQGVVETSTGKQYLSLGTGTSGSATEAMRISSVGNVSIGKNGVLLGTVGVHFIPEGTIAATKDGAIPLVLNRVATGTNNLNGVIAQFRRATVTVGNISVSDGATAYNTSSDYRLKENVVELTSASERINQLKPSRFNWISDDTNTVIDGFIAHEVATVVPEAITGAKDAMIDEEYEVTPEVLDEDGNVTTEAVMGTRSVPDYQGIDQSKLVPLLTAALQEALTEISSLKSRVEALEG